MSSNGRLGHTNVFVPWRPAAGPATSGPRDKAMRAILSTIGLCAVLAGCANNSETQISYLGFVPASADEADAPVNNAQPPAAVKHMDSNRVLGAIAFEKVTRAKVDPERLTGSRR